MLKVKATVVRGVFDSSGPDWNLCTCVTPCDETSSRRSASELLIGTLYITPLTFISDLARLHEIWNSFAALSSSSCFFWRLEVGYM